MVVVELQVGEKGPPLHHLKPHCIICEDFAKSLIAPLKGSNLVNTFLSSLQCCDYRIINLQVGETPQERTERGYKTKKIDYTKQPTKR